MSLFWKKCFFSLENDMKLAVFVRLIALFRYMFLGSPVNNAFCLG